MGGVQCLTDNSTCCLSVADHSLHSSVRYSSFNRQAGSIQLSINSLVRPRPTLQWHVVVFFYRDLSLTLRGTLSRRVMETMETQTITTVTRSLSHTHQLLRFYDIMHWLCTHTHIYCQGSSHPTAVAAPQAQLREGNAETYRESERWATWRGKKEVSRKERSTGTLSNRNTANSKACKTSVLVLPSSSAGK